MTHSKHPNGDQLQAFHDGELSASVTNELDEHCRQCQTCRNILAELDQTDQLLARIPTPELPRTVWHRVQSERRDERRLKPVFGIAACVAGIVLGVLVGPIQFSSEETSSDLAWSDSVSLWSGNTTTSLLTVYQTGQE